jgi:hypothetical protein
VVSKREAPIAVVVENGRLVPADAWAQDDIQKLPHGARFHAYLTLAVSDVDDEHGRLLTKYMAGIGDLYEWLPITGPGTDFPTATHVRKEILKQISFCEIHPRIDGTEKREPLSMSRDKMTFEDLQICFELTRLYVLAWTEHLTGKAYDPWKEWEDAHPITNQQSHP